MFGDIVDLARRGLQIDQSGPSNARREWRVGAAQIDGSDVISDRLHVVNDGASRFTLA
jgi:hypothetical protein